MFYAIIAGKVWSFISSLTNNEEEMSIPSILMLVFLATPLIMGQGQRCRVYISFTLDPKKSLSNGVNVKRVKMRSSIPLKFQNQSSPFQGQDRLFFLLIFQEELAMHLPLIKLINYLPPQL